MSRTREMLFSILAEDILDAVVLDLFSGCGSLGLEALSRGAARVVFVEKNYRSLETLRKNIETLGFGDCAFAARLDALGVINKPAVEERAPFDIVFLDPPYPMLKDEKGLNRFCFFMERLARSQLLTPDATVILRHENDVIDLEALDGWEVGRVRAFRHAQWTFLRKV